MKKKKTVKSNKSQKASNVTELAIEPEKVVDMPIEAPVQDVKETAVETPETPETSETPIFETDQTAQAQLSNDEKAPENEPENSFLEEVTGTAAHNEQVSDLPASSVDQSTTVASEALAIEGVAEADETVLNGYNPIPVIHSVRQRGRAMTIVNHVNGFRTSFRQDILTKIGSPNRVSVGVNKEEGVVYLTADENGQELKKSGKVTNVLYNKQLVEEATEAFGLDFSNCSSLGVMNVEYKKVNGKVYAFISK
ncbi:hypothetical protein [Sporosarcina sp. P33]|uniref:hypothetical protein n=1 Tax=Sporosarcina sp. P33 TaxID=1930764 RepID=UPI0009C149C2|nr:hypothetical protein [Sporosarcina sp. P33]ARD48842.1 hypothetical protein SporoP33_11810 [Sporosarcina sp. P33]